MFTHTLLRVRSGHLLRRGFHVQLPLLQEPRVNQVGIQYLSNELHKKVFPSTSPQDYLNPKSAALLDLAKAHLRQTGLLGKKTLVTEPIDIPNFPELVGKSTLDEHFNRIGQKLSEPYVSMAERFLNKDATLPSKPSTWVFQSGWTRYAPGEAPQSVDFPLEDELVFDVEVMYKVSPYSVLATAASPKAWYGWVSPILTNRDEAYNDWEHLIPLDTHSRPKLVVGYNVSYDRARVLEEYHIKASKAFYVDAMALHVALSGFCSQQRPTWAKHKKLKAAVESAEEGPQDDFDIAPEQELSAQDVAQELMDDPWLNKGSPNSLANVAEFHCGVIMNKEIRSTFSTKNVNDIIDDFQNLMGYCAHDVEVTHMVAKKLLPEFRRKNPHPVSFAALKPMGALFLPTTKKWESYIENAEQVYQENRDQVNSILKERAEELVRNIVENDESLKPDYENDPWLSQMNWELKEPRVNKDGIPRAKQAYLTGYPEWFRDLYKSVTHDDGTKLKEMNLTMRTRITPLLLRLKWEGHPLFWTDSAGWCFKVPREEEDTILQKNYLTAKLSDDENDSLRPVLSDDGNAYVLFKVPHPDGPRKKCVMIMTKSYVRYFDSGILTSQYDYAKEILNLNALASYWQGSRARIVDQFVVYSDTEGKKNKFFDTKKDLKSHKDMGIIIPKLCTMGTVTRRATENTWLTASNSKATRIGSELKAMIEAPQGYAFVGADVDSEELWIASLIGDSLFKIHGGTALGWMTLEGDKNEKTDLHSKTALILGILRNDAKIFNYGRIYGAGVKFATQLLQKCNADITDVEAAKKAQELYSQTKGQIAISKVLGGKLYHGGTESVMFNALEAIAHQESPKTPVLGASITDALARDNLNKNNYLTSRVNWTIQSSGVDYLHLLVTSMEYLIEKFKIDARLMITVHDELRYIVKEEQKLVCALLLQISNVWTRAMFCEQLGIKELPQSCAFFSEVDVDFVLRKEVGMDCVTPSHPDPIAPGTSYDIVSLQKAINASEILGAKAGNIQALRNYKYKSRQGVIDLLDADLTPQLHVAKLKLQNSVDKDEWKNNLLHFSRILRNSSNLHFETPYTPSKKTTVRKITLGEASNTKRTTKKSTTKKASRSERIAVAPEEYDLSADGDELLQEELSSVAQKARTFEKHARTTGNANAVSKSSASKQRGSNSSQWKQQHINGYNAQMGSVSSKVTTLNFDVNRFQYNDARKVAQFKHNNGLPLLPLLMRKRYSQPLDAKQHFSTTNFMSTPKRPRQIANPFRLAALKNHKREYHRAATCLDDNFKRRAQYIFGESEYRVGRGRRRNSLWQ